MTWPTAGKFDTCCRAPPPPPPCRVQQTIRSLKNTVRTGVFVGHTVHYARQCVKRRSHIPGHKIASPFKAQCDGGFQLALFKVEAHVAVLLHAEKLNMLPWLGALLVTGRSGSPIRLKHLGDGQI